jgi:hypothetical protein
MDPHYFSMLTLMLVPDTELYLEWQSGTFQLMGPEAMLDAALEQGRSVLRPEFWRAL